MMNQNSEEHYTRVVYTGGGEFYTTAKTALEYVIDPTFIQFLLMSIFLFSTLMLALGIPFIPQIFLFGAGVVTTFLGLLVLIMLYMLVLKWSGGKTIYTPLLLVPMHVMSMCLTNYLLGIFETSLSDGFNGLWEFALRSLIIIVCLDVFHGKFVAPQHRMAADLDDQGRVVPLNAVSPPKSAEKTATQYTLPPESFVQATTVKARATPDPHLNRVDVSPLPRLDVHSSSSIKVVIGKESFDLKSVQFIKSEDHYLVVQEPDKSEMVRGKLQDVAATIDLKWGAQINRSVWIAYAAINEVNENEKGQLEVQLQEGSVFRVAESRRLFFVHNYQGFQQSDSESF